MKRVIGIAAILAAVVVGALWYAHWSKMRALNSGDVFVRDQPSDNAKPAAPETAATSQPSQPKDATASGADTATQPPKQANGGVVATQASEAFGRNPPNGIVFAGSGKFEVYRQGDITWRLNTETGQACVLLATDAQWSKMRVFERGCKGG